MERNTLPLESLMPTLDMAIGQVILTSGVRLPLPCMNSRIARVTPCIRVVFCSFLASIPRLLMPPGAFPCRTTNRITGPTS